MLWIASIGCQNNQNKAKLQKWSKSNDLHRFDVKTIKNVELRRKAFKTMQNYKTDQMQWIASVGCQNDQNKSKLQKWSKLQKSSKLQKWSKLQRWSKSNDLHRFDVKTIKTKQNYKSDQYPMTCIDLTSKRSIMLSLVPKHSKQRKTTKSIKIQWLASIWFKTIKNVELRRKTFKTTQNYKIDQIAMNCIAWMSERSKQC